MLKVSSFKDCILKDRNFIKTYMKRSGNIFAGRPMSFVYGIFSKHHPDGDGIILSQNEKWSHQRRFALKVFRDFGMGKNMMEQKIRYYTDTLVQYLKKEIGANGLVAFVTFSCRLILVPEFCYFIEIQIKI